MNADYRLGEVSIERDVPFEARDGTVLRADIYRRDGSGHEPVLLMRTPYDKQLAQSIVYRHPVWYARRGYVVVVADTRGRYASDGEFEPFRTESEDGYDTVQWVANLPGTTGRVGMYGFSYAGYAQLLAATKAPPALACLVPAFTGWDPFDDYVYRGGAFQLASVVSWVLEYLALPDLIKRDRLDDARRVIALLSKPGLPAVFQRQPLEDTLSFLRDAGIEYLGNWLEHDSRDGYWQELADGLSLDSIRVPCLHIGGWYDPFAASTVSVFRKLSEGGAAEQRLIMGPWVHLPWTRTVGAVDFGPEAAGRVDDLQLAWFDRWLKRTAPSEPDPAARLFTIGANVWRTADTWPPEEVAREEWYLRSGGSASSSGHGRLDRQAPLAEDPDVFVYRPTDPAPSVGGRACCDPESTPMGPQDQREVETRNDVLVYTSEPMRRPLEITGDVELLLYASTDAVDTDWTTKLVMVAPEGPALNLCGGIIRARFRDSLDSPEAVEPGAVHRYLINLGPTSAVFPPGSRVRLEVSSSDWPAYDANVNTGASVASAEAWLGATATQAAFHDAEHPSHLRLPVCAA